MLETMRLTERKQALMRKDKETCFADLLSFSKTFKLKQPCPDDLLPILTKDVDKQAQIRENLFEKTVIPPSPKVDKPHINISTSSHKLEMDILTIPPSKGNNASMGDSDLIGQTVSTQSFIGYHRGRPAGPMLVTKFDDRKGSDPLLLYHGRFTDASSIVPRFPNPGPCIMHENSVRHNKSLDFNGSVPNAPEPLHQVQSKKGTQVPEYDVAVPVPPTAMMIQAVRSSWQSCLYAI
jgi:hypothetical protein